MASTRYHGWGADNNNQFWCLIADLPGFWILDENFNLRQHKTPRSQDGSQYTGPIHKMLFDSAGGIWCGTNKGIYKYDYEKNVLCPIDYELVNTDVFGSAWIREMILLRDHSILFSTFGGVYRITNSNNKPLVTPLKFLKPGSFNGFGQLYQDAGNLVYIKSLSDSLYIFSASPNGDLHLYQALNFKPDINNFFSDRTDSLVFLATTDGVYYISRNNFQIRKASFSSKLPFLNICNGLKQEGRFWLFGQRGLYFFDEKTEQGRMYTIEDGLPANEFSLSPIVYSSNKKCIAGSSNGLVSFFPNQKQDSIYPPRPSITKVFVNDIAYASSNNPNEFEQLRLSHIQNTFSFHFAPIAFQHTAQSSFEFMLEGYDETWIKTNTANYTRYSKIPPGKYLLRLRALDAMGRVSPFSKVLEIEIAKAFWQTSVFRVFVVVFLGLMGWLLAKSYFKRRMIKQKLEFEKQQAIERERTRIATDMHDDLGAGLSRIKFLSQALSNKTTEDDSLKTGLEKIIGFSDEMTEKMGEIVWALNEKNDTLADLVAYTRSYAMEYLANHNISCDMNTPNNLPGSFIPGEVRRNIFLTVKECLHNIIKHSEATKVDFVIELNHRIEITIHDNGKGIDWNNRRAFSNGLQNIDHRCF